jgi:hypothetical protein
VASGPPAMPTLPAMPCQASPRPRCCTPVLMRASAAGWYTLADAPQSRSAPPIVHSPVASPRATNEAPMPARQAAMSRRAPKRSARTPPGRAPTPKSTYPAPTRVPSAASVTPNADSHTVIKMGIESS